jgi:hypothetical protein
MGLFASEGKYSGLRLHPTGSPRAFPHRRTVAALLLFGCIGCSTASEHDRSTTAATPDSQRRRL